MHDQVLEQLIKTVTLYMHKLDFPEFKIAHTCALLASTRTQLYVY